MRKIIVVSALLAMSPIAFAGSLNTSSTANSGFYAGLQGGIGGMNTKTMNSADKAMGNGTYSQDLRGFTARPYVGYMWRNNNFAYGAELGYIYYPNNTYTWGPDSMQTKLKYSGFAIDALGVGKYYFNSGFNVIGKAGLAYVSQKTKMTNELYSQTVDSFSKTKGKILPEVALGLGYDFNQNFGMNVTYSHIFGNTPKRYSDASKESDLTKVADINTLMLGVTYQFS